MAALAQRCLDQDAPELGHALDEQRSRHHRLSGKMIGEDVVRERHALDGRRALRRPQREDPIEEKVPHRSGDYIPGGKRMHRIDGDRPVVEDAAKPRGGHDGLRDLRTDADAA